MKWVFRCASGRIGASLTTFSLQRRQAEDRKSWALGIATVLFFISNIFAHRGILNRMVEKKNDNGFGDCGPIRHRDAPTVADEERPVKRMKL